MCKTLVFTMRIGGGFTQIAKKGLEDQGMESDCQGIWYWVLS
jgi:hypothetical protein